MALKFFEAIQHFYRGQNAWAFFLPYILVATLGTTLIQLFTIYVLRDAIIVLFENVALFDAPETDQEALLVFWEALSAAIGSKMWAVWGVSAVSLLFWVMMSVSVQRYYIFGASFSITLAKDEFRVCLAMVLLSFVMFFGAAIILLGASIIAVVLMSFVPAAFGVVFLVAMSVVVYLGLRFALIIPLTVRDGEFRFMRSFGATQGRMGYIFGCVIVYYIIYIVAIFLLDTFALTGLNNPSSDAGAAAQWGSLRLLENGQITIAYAAVTLASSALTSAFYYVVAGPLAYAVTLDRNSV